MFSRTSGGTAGFAANWASGSVPDGNDDVQPLKPLDRVGVGEPVAVTVKVPALPTVKVVELALVIAGAWFTVRVKVWVAGLPTPLLAWGHSL